jgi:OOP family OmpA-OmpF porin
MATDTPLPARRYRRRILAVGALAFVVVFSIGAAIFIPVVQNDLRDRVEERLADDGIAGVTASFSGQDGTLTCTSPLDAPAAVERLAEGLWGVRVIDLDPSCRRGSGDSDATSGATTVAPPTDASLPVEAATTSVPEQESILDIVGDDPLFGKLAGLLTTAELTGPDGLGGAGPFTLLAPTDAAFDAAFAELDADGFRNLTSDPELLRTILLHHVVDRRILSTDLETGSLTMIDGSDVEVDADAITFTSGDSVAGVEDPATQLDIVASNGVIHAIDRLVLPADLDVTGPNAVTTTATWTDGRMVLTGEVQSDLQRQQLVAAAQQVVDPANIDDQLVVESTSDVADDDAGRLTQLVAAMPSTLVSGTAQLVGDGLSLTGVYLDDGANATITAAADAVDASADLTPRPVADDSTALALQAQLNEFVRLNPILFEPGSTVLTPAATSVIEQIAARALQLEGTAITIIGHTDRDGDAGANQRLSEGRAASVLAAVVGQGVPPESLQSQGRGEESPIVDAGGVEDKAASRRVEFVVVAR